MSRDTCAACGRDAGGANYCPNCGTSMGEEAQQRASDEYHGASERRRLAAACEELQAYTRSAGEGDALARIKARIEDEPWHAFVERDYSDEGEEATAGDST